MTGQLDGTGARTRQESAREFESRDRTHDARWTRRRTHAAAGCGWLVKSVAGRLPFAAPGACMPHPDFAKAAAHVTADNVRDLLVDLVNIPSATGNEIGVAQYLVERMGRSGLATDLPLVEQGRPNAVGHLRGRGDGLNLLFTGHMDTSY